MSNNQNDTKKSHKKRRRKVSDLPYPTTTSQERSGSNEDTSSPVINNTVIQASQSGYHHAAGALLTLSSSPGRVRPPSTTTPFHSIVDCIVGDSSATSLSCLSREKSNNRSNLTINAQIKKLLCTGDNIKELRKLSMTRARLALGLSYSAAMEIQFIRG